MECRPADRLACTSSLGRRHRRNLDLLSRGRRAPLAARALVPARSIGRVADVTRVDRVARDRSTDEHRPSLAIADHDHRSRRTDRDHPHQPDRARGRRAARSPTRRSRLGSREPQGARGGTSRLAPPAPTATGSAAPSTRPFPDSSALPCPRWNHRSMTGRTRMTHADHHLSPYDATSPKLPLRGIRMKA